MNDKQKTEMAILIKEAKDGFSPVMHKELHTQLAKEHKIAYDCYRKEGFTVLEALRLTAKYFD